MSDVRHKLFNQLCGILESNIDDMKSQNKLMRAALERCVGELEYAAEKLPESNAREALKMAREALQGAK
jgi:hypothetical protein